MTTAASRIAAIFADARLMQGAALRLLEQGDLRDAAEKSWCAAKRATDALILARTGEETERSPDTSRELQRLARADDAFLTLMRRYFSRQVSLHGRCFYLGECAPVDETERRIRETTQYIDDADTLAHYRAGRN